MPKRQGSKKSRRQSADKNTRTRVNPKVVLAVVAMLVVIGIVWAIIAARQSANTAQACTPTNRQYPSEPSMQIDTSKQYTATVKMAKGGEFTIQLYPDKAPRTVNSFVFLARDHFFDCVTFFRVLKDFMAQAGDPTGKGIGGPGYQFATEISDLTFDKAGVVAMTRSSEPDSNGSQFFITYVPRPDLNGEYTIFGQVISGMDVVNGLAQRDPLEDPAFLGDAIETITITER